MTKYTIKGSYIPGLLGRRLNEVRIDGFSEESKVPGIIIYTSLDDSSGNAVFYSEIYRKGEDNPLQRNEMTETLNELVYSVTKNQSLEGRMHFSVEREISED